MGMKKAKMNQTGVAHIAAFLLIVVFAVVGFAGWKVWKGQEKKNNNQTNAAVDSDQATADIKISVQKKGELILPNGHADPTVVPTDYGYRMYVNRQKDGNYGTFTSVDGATWVKESDVVIPLVSTGRAVVLPTGIRVYYPGTQPIRASDPKADMFSSFSTDGKSFTKDAGVRLSPRSADYYVEGPTVFQLPDNSWRMYFNENSVAAAMQRDGEIWGASSPDGLTWTRDDKPTIQASDEEGTINGKRSPWKQVLHPFVLKNPKGGYIMFYNSHSEMFAATSTDGLTWKKLGLIGIYGADIDGYFQKDGTIRAYYGGYTAETGGLVYTAVLKVEQ